jgi:hypothetical protein
MRIQNSIPMKTKLSVLFCGAVCAAASFTSVSAATLVSWGPTTTYVTATQATSRTSSGGVISFDLSTALSPVSGYTGGAFYGGVTATGTNGLTNGLSVQNDNTFNGGGNDAVLFGRTATNTLSGDKVTGVFMWKQSDFLTSSTGSVELSSLSYTGRYNGTATGNEVRWVIQQGSTYIISSNVGLSNSITTFTTTNLSTLSWFSYDPTTSITSTIGSTAIVNPSFSGVTATGLYMTATNSVDAAAINLAFSAFSATSTSAIPEPSTVALILGFGSLGLVTIRKLKNRSRKL